MKAEPKSLTLATVDDARRKHRLKTERHARSPTCVGSRQTIRRMRPSNMPARIDVHPIPSFPLQGGVVSSAPPIRAGESCRAGLLALTENYGVEHPASAAATTVTNGTVRRRQGTGGNKLKTLFVMEMFVTLGGRPVSWRTDRAGSHPAPSRERAQRDGTFDFSTSSAQLQSLPP